MRFDSSRVSADLAASVMFLSDQSRLESRFRGFVCLRCGACVRDSAAFGVTCFAVATGAHDVFAFVFCESGGRHTGGVEGLWSVEKYSVFYENGFVTKTPLARLRNISQARPTTAVQRFVIAVMFRELYEYNVKGRRDA